MSYGDIILAQCSFPLMACCFWALSHYQNQCWFEIFHPSQYSFTENVQYVLTKIMIKNYIYRYFYASAEGQGVNSSHPGQNGHHLADDIFHCIFMNDFFCILILVSLECVPKGPIDNDSALVQVMAWHQTGNKSLPEPMLTKFTDAYMRH